MKTKIPRGPTRGIPRIRLSQGLTGPYRPYLHQHSASGAFFVLLGGTEQLNGLYGWCVRTNERLPVALGLRNLCFTDTDSSNPDCSIADWPIANSTNREGSPLVVAPALPCPVTRCRDQREAPHGPFGYPRDLATHPAGRRCEPGRRPPADGHT